jgi:multidrug efflux pump
VFIPTAFISGISGQFYRQFALTIATATLISAFNSLTLSPALAALLLRPHGDKPDLLSRGLNFAFGWLFRGFNRLFEAGTAVYGRLVGQCIRGTAAALLVYMGLLVLTWHGFVTVPTGFVPDQDKGYLLATVQLPDSASLERTEAVMRQIDGIVNKTPGVAHRVTISGQSFLLSANGSNFGSMFVILDDFEHRRKAGLDSDTIAAGLRRQLYRQVEEAQVGVFGAPPIDGLGNAGGFKLMVQDRQGLGLTTLQGQTDNLVEKGNQTPGLAGLFSMFRADTPQLYLNLNRTKCKMMGIALSDVFNALQTYLGGYYVNDFNMSDRTWQVNLQADAQFRIRPEDVGQLKVRNARGGMVPLATLADVRDASGAVLVNRYNMYPAAAVNGDWTPETSSGQAMARVQALAAQELAQGMDSQWTDLSYQESKAGNTALWVFPLCVLLVFLTHAAEYESISLPLAIILIVPMSLLCALAGVWLRGMDNNIFTQVGFVLLAGLACKNAVLIVEFAKQQQEHGLGRRAAAIEASRLRLRPIMMTSFAFILGVVPLAIAQGAGAEMRRAMGTAVFAGMLGVTFFGIFLTPVFYYVLRGFSPDRPDRPDPAAAPPDGPPLPGHDAPG